jgi:hypothetical protein
MRVKHPIKLFSVESKHTTDFLSNHFKKSQNIFISIAHDFTIQKHSEALDLPVRKRPVSKYNSRLMTGPIPDFGGRKLLVDVGHKFKIAAW